jgi:hypothetical protein
VTLPRSKQKFRQGVYTVKNRQKYIGKKPPIFRSSWEMSFMQYLDEHEKVKGWCCECVVVPYTFNGKPKRYFPDFLVVWEDNKTQVIEIKPHRETKPPRQTKNKSRKTLLYEQFTYLKNQLKWKAANEFCLKKDWEFKILTEKDITI